jgi:hypothetical protein
MRNSRENEDNVYYLWKQYLAKSGGKTDGAEEKQQTDLFNGVFGDDDDDGAAAGGAAEVSAAAPEPEASQAGDE